MNISELKEMAHECIRLECGVYDVERLHDVVMSKFIFLRDAILSIPDDDGEELVRLAEPIVAMSNGYRSDSITLARAVLSRYSKREEKKSGKCPFCGNNDGREFGVMTTNTTTQIRCQSCGAAGPEARTIIEATSLWDKRVSPRPA